MARPPPATCGDATLSRCPSTGWRQPQSDGCAGGGAVRHLEARRDTVSCSRSRHSPRSAAIGSRGGLARIIVRGEDPAVCVRHRGHVDRRCDHQGRPPLLQASQRLHAPTVPSAHRSAEVGSSSNRIGAPLSIARAMTTRWRCPPDRPSRAVRPHVSRPQRQGVGEFGDRKQPGRRRAPPRGGRLGDPRRMFSAMVASKSAVSCPTTAIASRRRLDVDGLHIAFRRC